jgi:hypothetical protein
MDTVDLVFWAVALLVLLIFLVLTRRNRMQRIICTNNMLHHSNGTTGDTLTLRNDLLARMLARRQAEAATGGAR